MAGVGVAGDRLHGPGLAGWRAPNPKDRPGRDRGGNQAAPRKASATATGEAAAWAGTGMRAGVAPGS